MRRYCTHCEKEYDLKVNGVADLEHLVCPVCGNPIDKNSRKPRDVVEENRTEEAIGEAILTIYNVIYSFFVIFGVLGIISYILDWDILLYICTVVSILAYMRMHTSEGKELGKGFLGVVIGGVAGWFLLHTIQGACFGALLVLVSYYVLRMIILAIIKMVMKRL